MLRLALEYFEFFLSLEGAHASKHQVASFLRYSDVGRRYYDTHRHTLLALDAFAGFDLP